MARPRTPTAVLKLRGSIKRHPGRYREQNRQEPQGLGPLGEPPTCLDKAQGARWHELAAMYPWLTFADRGIVEQTVRLWMVERSGQAKASQSKLLQQCWRLLGGTPSDRSKVAVPPVPMKDENPFTKFV
jgi:hypothetical protein